MSREERTIVEETLDNKRGVARAEEGGYDYAEVKLALTIVFVMMLIICVIHFITTGSLSFR